MKRTAYTPQRRLFARAPSWLSPGSAAARDTERRSGAQGQHGAVHFFLQRVQGGLYVEREEIPRHGIRVCQSLLFSEQVHFEHWRGDDPIRFEHPQLYLQLQRDAEALWEVESTDHAGSR
jgi:hypothetical protein